MVQFCELLEVPEETVCFMSVHVKYSLLRVPSLLLMLRVDSTLSGM